MNEKQEENKIKELERKLKALQKSYKELEGKVECALLAVDADRVSEVVSANTDRLVDMSRLTQKTLRKLNVITELNFSYRGEYSDMSALIAMVDDERYQYLFDKSKSLNKWVNDVASYKLKNEGVAQ